MLKRLSIPIGCHVDEIPALSTEKRNATLQKIQHILQDSPALEVIFAHLPGDAEISEELISALARSKKITNDEVIYHFFEYCHNLIISGNIDSVPKFNLQPLRASSWGMNKILKYTRGFNIIKREHESLEKQFMHQYADIGFRLYLLGIENFHNIWWEGPDSGINQIQATLDEMTSDLYIHQSCQETGKDCCLRKTSEFQRLIAFCETVHSLMGLEMANMQKQEPLISLHESIVQKIRKINEDFSFRSPELLASQSELLYLSGRQILAFQQLANIAGETPQEVTNNTETIIKKLNDGKMMSFSAIRSHPFWDEKVKQEKYKEIEQITRINSEYVRGVGLMKAKKLLDKDGESTGGMQLTGELSKTCQFFVDFHSSLSNTPNKTIHEFIDETLSIPPEKWDFSRLAILHNLLIFEEYTQSIGEDHTIKILEKLISSMKGLGGIFPEYRIKSCARAIESLRLHGSKHYDYVNTIEKFIKQHESLLSPIPGYSRLYLAFSIYYSEMEGEEAVNKAMESFAHYHDIVGGNISDKFQSYKTRLFLRFSGGKKEFNEGKILPQSKTPETVPAEKAGEIIFGHFNKQRTAQKKMKFSQTIDMSDIRFQDKEMCEEEYIGRIAMIVCPMIKDIFFHDHCEVFLQKSSTPRHINSVFHAIEIVPIDENYSLQFIYPKRFESIFFSSLHDSQQYIAFKIQTLISEYSNKRTIREQQAKLLEVYSRNPISQVHNEKTLQTALNIDKTGQRVMVLIDVSNLGDIGRTFGEDMRQSISKSIAHSLPIFLEKSHGYAGFDIYHFDDGTYCIDFHTPIDKKNLGEQLMYFFEEWKFAGFLSSDLNTFPDNIPYVLNPYIGIAVGPGKEAFENAQRALSETRSERRHGYTIHSNDMNVREFEGVHIGHLLSRAITTGQITPHFQAIVDNTQKAVKYECLCRFSPDFELGDSAKYPLWKILENGKHNPQLLQGVLSGVKKKNVPTDLALSFNLANVDLESPRLLATLEEYLGTDRKSEDTTLEVLEERMKFSQSALDNLQKLKDKGFKIALDDFGSGNSNIDRLIKLQGLIDVIKLDGIVVDINNPITNEYIRATVAIAKVIGIKTLVERVETFEQFIALKTLGIDYFQGYFFHKPSPLPEYRKGDVF